MALAYSKHALIFSTLLSIVACLNRRGIFQVGDDSLSVEQSTFAMARAPDNVSAALSVFVADCTRFDSNGIKLNTEITDSVLLDADIGLSVQNSACVNRIALSHSALYDVSLETSGTAFLDESTLVRDVSPGFDTDRYGVGAYLIHSSTLIDQGTNGGFLGAEILYRLQDGVQPVGQQPSPSVQTTTFSQTPTSVGQSTVSAPSIRASQSLSECSPSGCGIGTDSDCQAQGSCTRNADGVLDCHVDGVCGVRCAVCGARPQHPARRLATRRA